MCSIVKQSTIRKSDQSEVAISGQLANQNPGKRTNQKTGYKKKQPIDSIDTKLTKTDVTVENIVQCYSSGGRFDQWSERRRTRRLEI